MGTFSIWHWLVVLVIVVLVFGTKKLRNLGGDLGSAIKNFKEGMKDAETENVASQSSNQDSLAFDDETKQATDITANAFKQNIKNSESTTAEANRESTNQAESAPTNNHSEQKSEENSPTADHASKENSQSKV